MAFFSSELGQIRRLWEKSAVYGGFQENRRFRPFKRKSGGVPKIRRLGDSAEMPFFAV